MNLIFSLRRGLGRKEVKWAAFVLIFIWNKRVLILSFLLLSFEVTKPFIKKSRSFIMKISFAHHEINLDFWSKWRSIVFITLIWTSQKKKKKNEQTDSYFRKYESLWFCSILRLKITNVQIKPHPNICLNATLRVFNPFNATDFFW